MEPCYKNKKNKKIYEVMFYTTDCTNSRDGTQVVVYFEVGYRTKIFTRDKKEFDEKFVWID